MGKSNPYLPTGYKVSVWSVKFRFFLWKFFHDEKSFLTLFPWWKIQLGLQANKEIREFLNTYCINGEWSSRLASLKGFFWQLIRSSWSFVSPGFIFPKLTRFSSRCWSLVGRPYSCLTQVSHHHVLWKQSRPRLSACKWRPHLWWFIDAGWCNGQYGHSQQNVEVWTWWPTGAFLWRVWMFLQCLCGFPPTVKRLDDVSWLLWIA